MAIRCAAHRVLAPRISGALRCLLALLFMCSMSAQALSLRMEPELQSREVGESHAATEQLIRFGSSDLHRRLDQYREQAQWVGRENLLLEGQITGYEELIARMTSLSGVQERALGVLQSTLTAQKSAPVPAGPPVAAQPLSPATSQSGNQARTRDQVQDQVQDQVRDQVRDQVQDQVRDQVRNEAPGEGEAHSASVGVTREPGFVPPTLTVAGVTLPQWLLGVIVGVLVSVLLGLLWRAIVGRRNRPASASMPTAVARTQKVVPRDEHAHAMPAHEPRSSGDAGVAHARLRSAAAVVATKLPLTTESDDAPASGAAQDPGGEGIAAVGVKSAAGTETDSTSLDEAVRDAATSPAVAAVDAKADSDTDAERQALKEVDILIAFEQFDKAKALLDQLISRDPDNPEYTLRHYHVRTHGGLDTTTDDEEILRAMMDGPMSDTLKRMREIGRGLMPGDPLFEDKVQREEATQALKNASPEPISGTSDIDDLANDIDMLDAMVNESKAQTAVAEPAVDPGVMLEYPSADGDARADEAAKALPSADDASVGAEPTTDEFAKTVILTPGAARPEKPASKR